MVEKKASDLFFAPFAPVKIKIDGKIMSVNKMELTPKQVRQAAICLNGRRIRIAGERQQGLVGKQNAFIAVAKDRLVEIFKASKPCLQTFGGLNRRTICSFRQRFCVGEGDNLCLEILVLQTFSGSMILGIGRLGQMGQLLCTTAVRGFAGRTHCRGQVHAGRRLDQGGQLVPATVL